MLTQVVVDAYDPAFKNPTKPIGAFMTKEEAEKMAREKGWNVAEDAGRGWRQVVASPKPMAVVELTTIRDLTDAGMVDVYKRQHGAVSPGGQFLLGQLGSDIVVIIGDIQNPPAFAGGQIRRGLIGSAAPDAFAV